MVCGNPAATRFPRKALWLQETNKLHLLTYLLICLTRPPGDCSRLRLKISSAATTRASWIRLSLWQSPAYRFSDSGKTIMVYSYYLVFFWRPFVKWFAHPIGPLSVCPVLSCLWRWCTVVKRLDGSDQYETWHAGRPQPKRHCVRWPSSLLPQEGSTALNFRPMSIVDTFAHLSYFWALVLSFSVHRFFDVPEPIFAKLCHTTRYVMRVFISALPSP